MKNVYCLVLVCFMTALSAFGQEKQTREQYIEKYKNLAIKEMHRAGVPASITMAQGILESSNGNSRLSRKGNNHFGIKCKSTWKGKTMRANDDAPNECFRAYDSPEESYRDHSDFLRNNWRYHELFDLDITNYKGWARGLRKAGYATNQSYHTMLINLVEKHELYKLDIMSAEPLITIPVVLQNEVPIVYAEKDETIESIADENELTNRQIYKYNDLKDGQKIEEGDIVYLKPKRRRGSQKFHTVKSNESMYQISQQYGIKLKHLYRRNRLEMGAEPIEGSQLYMRGKRTKTDSLPTKTENQIEKEKEAFVNPHNLKVEKAPPIEKENIDLPSYHVVVKGDNIYRIAEKYHVFEEDLLKWNKISALQLTLGRKIYLTKESAEKALGENPEVPKDDPVIPATKYHIVKKGETVYRITQMYHITAEQLAKWNRLTGNQINIGQKLRVSE
ncbi:MAG: LysM peptidoglycan-binding domain-containing protein [Bacteroidetes bacterium]|jgi:LysM repeat protein|nr:LysM peptidoglycan-binding domain-containing protein [Bacteroidota bacterium]